MNDRKIFLIIALVFIIELAVLFLFFPTKVEAGGFFIYTSAMAFDENMAEPEIMMGSPWLGYGFKYVHNPVGNLFMEYGYRHESNLKTRELGLGINGIVIQANWRLN